jgi:hypothetical protein
LTGSPVTTESGSPVRDVFAKGHSVDPRCQSPVSTATADPSQCLDDFVSPVLRLPDRHNASAHPLW